MKFTRSVLSQQKEIPSSCILSSARLCQQKRQSAWWRCRSWGRPPGPFCCCSSWLGSRRASCWDPVDWCCWWWNILTGISCQYYSWPPSQTDNTSSFTLYFSFSLLLDFQFTTTWMWAHQPYSFGVETKIITFYPSSEIDFSLWERAVARTQITLLLSNLLLFLTTQPSQNTASSS